VLQDRLKSLANALNIGGLEHRLRSMACDHSRLLSFFAVARGVPDVGPDRGHNENGRFPHRTARPGAVIDTK
jgi:hypothetical protein